MVKKITKSVKKTGGPDNEKPDPARKRTQTEKHALEKRVRSMAAPGGKRQFNRMLAMTQPTKEEQAAAE